LSSGCESVFYQSPVPDRVSFEPLYEALGPSRIPSSPLAFAAMMWTFMTAILEFATGSIGDRTMADVIANICARRKWARENAACALAVFGTMAAVLLFDSRSVRADSTRSVDDTRSAPRSSSHQERTILDALIAWLTSPACEVTSTTACTDAVVPGEGQGERPVEFALSE
jgi:hypothetical protein